jgi:hypothetical protein
VLPEISSYAGNDLINPQSCHSFINQINDRWPASSKRYETATAGIVAARHSGRSMSESALNLRNFGARGGIDKKCMLVRCSGY